MEFKPVRAEDKQCIDNYLRQIDSRSCDLAFASIYLWRNEYQMEFAECEDMIVFKSNEERVSFSFPIGAADPGKVIGKIKEYCREHQIPLIFHSVTKEIEEYLNQNYPGEFEVEFDRDLSDYIYETQALMELKGKKYHGKKNHVNKFKKTFDWSYEPVTDDNLSECIEMLHLWKKDNCSPEDLEKHAEICVAEHALTEREMLGLKAGLIRADGRVVAFSVGEKIASDTFCVHFEKAFADVPGAYSIINQEFLIHEASDCKYVNREDDVGDEGLRKAKLSYRPAFLLDKGVAFYRN